jgi:hypothetical protein
MNECLQTASDTLARDLQSQPPRPSPFPLLRRPWVSGTFRRFDWQHGFSWGVVAGSVIAVASAVLGVLLLG